MREFAGYFLPSLLPAEMECGATVCEREWFVLKNSALAALKERGPPMTDGTADDAVPSLQSLCALSHMWSNWRRLGATYRQHQDASGTLCSTMENLQRMHTKTTKLPMLLRRSSVSSNQDKDKDRHHHGRGHQESR